MVEHRESIWAKLFILAAIIQGLIALVITGWLIIPGLLPAEPSRVIAAGGAGTWLLAGYLGYLVVGVIGVAVTALFYHFLEVIQRRTFGTVNKTLAGAHLLGMNIGIAGAMWLMMLAGYRGGAAMLAEEFGGLGASSYGAHLIIYEVLGGSTYILGGFIGLLAIGVFIGGIGYVFAMTRKAEPIIV
ncbi:MAG: hypothetical protein ABIH76_07600 [Candidatus Bathyarchaeota archaeon]